MVTLFILLVVNNWQVAVQMFINVSGGSLVYRVYFILFYYFGVIMCINILVSFAIDMYNAVSRLDEQKAQNEEYLARLSKMSMKEF
jgi:hypothetical protein